jgi:organic radical activating enzyme
MENSVVWDREYTKETMSLCPVCYAVIPAKIQLLKNVWMKKQCPTHGVFVAMVERDPWWYTFCLRRASSSLYDGYFMDITNRCNISCKYCYSRCGSRDDVIIDRAIEDIFTEAKMYNRYAPFILTGGEPTTHPDFLEIIKRLSEIGETYFLTNGIKLCDEGFLKSVIDQGILGAGNELKIGLSIHRESNGRDIEFLNICKRKGYKIQTVLYTIDKIDQINDAISLFREFRETITRGRIRAASAIWSDKNLIVDKIFVSDMINHLQAMGPTEIINMTVWTCA